MQKYVKVGDNNFKAGYAFVPSHVIIQRYR